MVGGSCGGWQWQWRRQRGRSKRKRQTGRQMSTTRARQIRAPRHHLTWRDVARRASATLEQLAGAWCCSGRPRSRVRPRVGACVSVTLPAPAAEAGARRPSRWMIRWIRWAQVILGSSGALVASTDRVNGTSPTGLRQRDFAKAPTLSSSPCRHAGRATNEAEASGGPSIATPSWPNFAQRDPIGSQATIGRCTELGQRQAPAVAIRGLD